MPRLTSKHHNGKLSAGENRAAAQRAQARTRAFMARYRLAMLARKQEACRLHQQDLPISDGVCI